MAPWKDGSIAGSTEDRNTSVGCKPLRIMKIRKSLISGRKSPATELNPARKDTQNAWLTRLALFAEHARSASQLDCDMTHCRKMRSSACRKYWRSTLRLDHFYWSFVDRVCSANYLAVEQIDKLKVSAICNTNLYNTCFGIVAMYCDWVITSNFRYLDISENFCAFCKKFLCYIFLQFVLFKTCKSVASLDTRNIHSFF